MEAGTCEQEAFFCLSGSLFFAHLHSGDTVKLNRNERRAAMGTHWIDEGCINCAACAEVCPVEAISEQGEVHVIDKDVCTDCGACDEVCPVDVIKWETTA